jgi:hypothetical protein
MYNVQRKPLGARIIIFIFSGRINLITVSGCGIVWPMKIKYSSPFVDEVVVGQNSEFADMSNPQGLLYGRKVFVEATTESGRRFIFHRDFADQEFAGKFAARVETKGEINLELWVETYPIYGSPAWQVEDLERAARLRFAVASGDVEGIERYS